jgi:serralysin
MESVFLSYRQESDEHSDRVRALAERLRERVASHGISVVLDQFQPAGGPDQGWAKWSADQVRHSTRVLMVITPAYVECMLGNLKPSGGRGSAWEARAIYHELYQVAGVSGKYRALVFDDGSDAALPAEIGAIHTFRSPEDEDDLVGWVRREAERSTEAEPAAAKSLPKRRRTRTWFPWLVGGGAAVAALVLIAYFTGAAGWRAGSVREDPEFQRMVKMVEELHKQIPQPQPGRIQEEAEARAESPERYRENTYYWPVGSTIRIGFLGGDQAVQDKVFAIAREWTKYANVSFVRSEAKDAEVRVSFEPTGEWSYLGTQSLSIPAGGATANLGEPVDFDDELESRHYTLHAFGHVLGLIHEFQTPAATSQVNLAKAIAYFAEPPNSWSRETVEANFKPLQNAGTYYADKPFDPYSVMLHRLPAEVLNSGKAFEPGDQLSPGDIAFIRRLYPGR